MVSIFDKPVAHVTLEDLQALIGHVESDRLEFKSEAYERNDEDTREMLRDISSFANGAGGYLIVGVETEKTGEGDKATAIVGIENGDEEAERMLQSCLAAIEERITGLDRKVLLVSEGRQAVVIFIPRSTRAPHMITFKGLYQCWKRYGAQKQKMTIEEIREACLRTENIRRSLEDFIAERREKVLRQIGDKPHLFLTATPLVVKDEVIETGDERVRELMRKPPDPQDTDWTVGGPERVTPSLYGLVAEIEGWQRLELFRNGHAEFRMIIDERWFCRERRADRDAVERLVIYSYSLAEYPLSFLHLVRAAAEQAGITEPVVVGMRLLNARGLGLLPYDPRGFDYRHPDPGDLSVWQDDQHLEVPEMQFPYPLDPGQAAKALVDGVYQAFGFEGCPVLDEQGNLSL
jgi:hypothetical protein